MPTISVFYGILIQMLWRDHAPPHFHALYAEDEALIEIWTLEVIQGLQTPKKDRALEIVPPINPRADWRVADVKALSGYRLRVRFNDAIEGEVDLSKLIQTPDAGVFAALRDEAVFRRVHVFLGAVTWPGGLDLAPDAMYRAIRERGEWIVS